MVFLCVHAHQPVMRNQYPLPQPSSAQPKVINHQHTQHLPSAHSFETVPTNMPYKDDGRVSWVETASMVAVFGLTLYFLAEHG